MSDLQPGQELDSVYAHWDGQKWQPGPGPELPPPPEKVSCCDEMRRAVYVGLVEGNQIEYFEESSDDSEFHDFTLNFCPFCGTAVGDTKEGQD